MKRNLKYMMVSGILFALACMLVLFYADSRQTLIYQTSCQKSGADYILYFKHSERANRKLNVLNLRPGRIFIRTHPKMIGLEIVTYDDTVEKADKVNDNLFKKSLQKNLVVTSIRFFPKSTSINRIDVAIARKPVYSVFFMWLQFVFLFLLFCLGWLTLHFLYSLIIAGESMADLSPHMLFVPMLLLFLTLFVYFVLNLGEFLDPFRLYRPVQFFGRTALFNAGLTALLLLLFTGFSLRRKGEKLPFYLPAVVALPIVIMKIPFAITASADSLLWVLNLNLHRPEISFAEALSLLLNKLTLHIANLVTQVRAETSLCYTGKLIGILFVFSLFYFINSFSSLSYKKKLLFFILFLTFAFNILPFGFPEFRYYALPFLLFSFLAAKKYLDVGRGDLNYLTVSALLAVAAGLFHGTAYFSFPAILLLPLLKRRAGEGKKSAFYLKHYSAIVFSVGAVFIIFFAAIKLFGYQLRFNTTVGGFDGRQFISFLPLNIHFPYAVNFLEVGYFGSRTWILLISGSFTLLVFISNWKKRILLATSDFVLFLFGLSQFVIVLFWGFDNGISEFDLYLTPPTLLYLFLLRYLSETIQAEKNAWKYICIFSLFSPLYPLLLKMIEA
jgi:hypothetical protein